MLCESPGTFWSDQVREAALSLSDRIATTFLHNVTHTIELVSNNINCIALVLDLT